MEKGRENFLEAIVNAISPSGFEEEAVRVWADRAKKYADRVYTELPRECYCSTERRKGTEGHAGWSY
ncbi:MAG: hypothetical protein WBI96_06840 [Candidatus Hydrothermia bacterium]